VRAATTGNITLSGEQTIDGVACVVGDDVLVKSQSTTGDNGVYTVASGAWSAASWDGADVTMVVREGTVNGGLIFTNATNIAKLTQSLPASAISSGEFDAARIPALDASKLTTGTFEADRLTFPGHPGYAYIGPTTTYPATGGVQPLADTIPPWMSLSAGALLTSGRLSIVGITLTKGQSITSVGFVGAAAMATGTNQWFCILNSAMQVVAVTVNDTSTAWGASTTKILALTGTYIVPSTGVYHLGIMVTATTPPTLSCIALATGGGVGRRVRSFVADTGLTTPVAVGFTATPTAGVSSVPWGFVA
jgi:hypothetical protein